LLSLVVAGAAAGPALAADDSVTAEARSHYEMGVQLFDAREHEQALIEFTKANDLKARPAALFMMAQCEYLLGRLKAARAHYQRYADENPSGEFASLARDRVGAIDNRPSTFVINCVPDDVAVRISPEGQTGNVVASGQAPNGFSVPRGRYRVDVTKPSFQGQTRVVDIDVAETKPLFFKLEPIPARLEIETTPPSATLYVNGNRARNPYHQELPPGPVEIFAEAPDFEARTLDLSLAPSERMSLTGGARFALSYRQRSGRPELIIASALLGGLLGAGAVAGAIGKDLDGQNVASVLLATGGGISGAVLGALVATPLVPAYIPDNRALFVIGGMWIGAADGFGASVVGYQIAAHQEKPVAPCAGEPCRAAVGDQLRAGFIGSVAGLGLGLTASALSAKRAPTYGRGTMIQSAAFGGAVTGALFQIATKWKPYGTGWERSVGVYDVPPTNPNTSTASLTLPPPGVPCAAPTASGKQSCAVASTSALDLTPGMLIGLNVGLAAGLLGAYLPDQTDYGPSWQRVLFIDLAAGAGAIAGGVFGCVGNVDGCLKAANPSDGARSIEAWSALAGAGVGAVAGVLGTRHFHLESAADRNRASVAAPVPVATLVPVRDASGALIPAFAALGTF
jgi:hypothetical protein